MAEHVYNISRQLNIFSDFITFVGKALNHNHYHECVHIITMLKGVSCMDDKQQLVGSG